MNFTPTYTKKQLRILLNVSASTLKNWLNKRYYEDLVKLGYRKNDRILIPKVLKYLHEKLDISIND